MTWVSYFIFYIANRKETACFGGTKKVENVTLMYTSKMLVDQLLIMRSQFAYQPNVTIARTEINAWVSKIILNWCRICYLVSKCSSTNTQSLFKAKRFMNYKFDLTVQKKNGNGDFDMIEMIVLSMF